MERASGDHLEDDQARRRRVGRDAERLQRIGSAQDAYLTLRMIENPAGDAQGILAAAEQLAIGRQTTTDAGRSPDRTTFSSRIEIGHASWRDRVCKCVVIAVLSVTITQINQPNI